MVQMALSKSRPAYSLDTLRGDVFGGVTAAVVALPLALAFGVASGAGAIAGLYGAIVVGFFASIFGGTPAQVSGPTGPITVVMAAVIATHSGNLSEAFAIVVLSGVLQILFGVLRLGAYITYTPYSVVSGFMTGIGLIIMIVQAPAFFGLPTPAGGVSGALKALAGVDLAALDPAAIMLSVAALALVVFWPKRLARIFPGPLAALIVGTLAAMWIAPQTPVIGPVPSGLPSIMLPQIPAGNLPMVFQAAFIVAILGSIDSLLTSLIADSVTRTQHNSNRELIGQGIGNAAAGMIGALPGAGATMRTLVNIRAGGRTPVSGALHALILLALALGLGAAVAHVPLAILAAILMKVGWDIIDWRYLKHMASAPRDKFIVMLVTLALTVFVDLIMAVAVGIILASFVNSRRIAEEQLKGVRQSTNQDGLDALNDWERAVLRAAGGKILVTVLSGAFSYASARELARRASPKITGVKVVIYDFTNAGYIDTSAALAVAELVTLAREADQTVLVAGLSEQARKTLDGLSALDGVGDESRFADRRAAIEYAAGVLGVDADPAPAAD